MPFTFEEVLQALRSAGCAHNGGAGGVHIVMGNETQMLKFANALQDKRWTEMLTRRCAVEQLMLDAARGKRPMPTAEELRAWAMKLGTPTDWETYGKEGDKAWPKS